MKTIEQLMNQVKVLESDLALLTEEKGYALSTYDLNNEDDYLEYISLLEDIDYTEQMIDRLHNEIDYMKAEDDWNLYL
jgi:hypothetical protein